MAFSPDGKYLAATYLWTVPDSDAYSGDGDVLAIWNTTTGAPVTTLKGVSGWDAFYWLPGSKHIVIKDFGETLWDIQSGRQITTPVEPSKLEWSPDGTLAAYSSDDGLHIVDGVTFEVWNVLSDIRGLTAWFPDGSKFIDGDNIIRDTDTGEELGRILLDRYPSAISANGQNFIIDDRSQYIITVWQITDQRGPSLVFHGTRIPNEIVWSPDGAQLVATRFRGDGAPDTLWNVASGSPVAVTPESGILPLRWYTPKPLNTWKADSIYGFILDRVRAHQRDMIAVVSSFNAEMQGRVPDREGGMITLIHAQTGEVVGKLPLFTESPLAVAWSPDDSQMAIGFNNENRVEIWDVGNVNEMQLVKTLQTDESLDSGEPAQYGFVQVEWSSDGSTIAGVYGFSPFWLNCNMCPFGIQGNLHLWNAATGKPIDHPAIKYGGEIIAFSPDGTMLAVGSLDGIITVWKTNP